MSGARRNAPRAARCAVKRAAGEPVWRRPSGWRVSSAAVLCGLGGRHKEFCLANLLLSHWDRLDDHEAGGTQNRPRQPPEGTRVAANTP